MPVYVVYGDPVFNTVEQRDAVAARIPEIADAAGLLLTGRVSSLPPGVTLYSHTEPVWPDEPGSGGTYPGVQIAYEGTDQEVVAQAQLQMQDVIWAPEEPRAGSFGTWTDMSS